MKFAEEPLFGILFPFHAVFDGAGNLLRLGNSLRKMCPDCGEGELFEERFEFLDRHMGFERIRRAGSGGLSGLIRHRASGVMLRGQFVFDEESSEALFVGSPWIRKVEQLLELGLGFGDFAKHDAMIDLLQMVQHQEARVSELKRVNDLAVARKRKIEEVNEKLVAREKDLERLASVVTATQNTVILTDLAGRIEWVNPSFTETTGFGFDEVKGLKPGEFLQGVETDASTKLRMHHCLERGEGFTADVLNYRKDGRKLWLRLEVSPVKDEGGVVTGFTGLQIDITEEKLIQWMETLFMKSSAGVAEPGGFQEEMSLVVGELAAVTGATWVGLYEEDPQGCMVLRGSSGEYERCEDCGYLIGAVDQVGLRETGEGGDGKAGECKCCYRYEVPLLSSGNRMIGSLVLLWRDMKWTVLPWGYRSVSAILARVIEWRRYERELVKAREEADRANAAKSVFLASVSHELRNPLQGIVGMVDLLEGELGRSGDRRSLKQLRSTIEHLSRVVGDLLLQEGAEYGRVEVLDEVYSPAEVLEGIRCEYLESARKAGLELGVRLGDGVPLRLVGDGVRVSQVLSNLVGNAIKFTDEGGIMIEVGVCPGWIEYEVIDSGCGFPAEVEDHLFEPYYQRGIEDMIHQEGVGLGLPICRTLVEKMGGEIEAIPRPEGGSCFRFRLPMKEASEDLNDSPRREDAEPKKVKGVRLMLAEDDPVVGELLERLLESEGYQVIRVSNGLEALEWMQREAGGFSVALIDQRMPVMDGLELARRVRSGEAGEHWKNLRMIALTASVGEKERQECLGGGFDRFVTKPVSFVDLISVIDELVESSF